MTILSSDLITVTESQLENHWSNRGAVKTAKKTHKSVRHALDQYDWPDWVRYKPFLQGSYKNHTNIHGDSDVDTVIRLDSVWRRDLSSLTEAQKRNYKQDHSSALNSLDDFREHVKKALRAHYDEDTILADDHVTQKDKCIAVETPYLDADVVVCQEYRLYYSIDKSDPEGYDYISGITFDTQSGNRIINFPRQHYQNGTDKHQSTNQRFKPMVRCFKNARTHLVEKREIPEDLAPSYFIECLVYNAPDGCFKQSYRDSSEAIINYLQDSRLREMNTQDGMLRMFGNEETQWSTQKAERTLKAWNKLLS
ncbi:nucleotidyltransferase domain-containing protein [Salinibacter ruber]|uniref:nucleotidyltransferase domain-containing protein n=1 Tax=Salinibacter ruber TaxID=146919 RepID=UPI0020737595|nr:nucleotidyltransferase [Salinibacter ruber]